mmetsp:Transcript_18220/g.48951  ORF Transcript_18220/g.48951 Transcript_18220/m.48951 type:complete len:203 (+) Transcript_18220:720-1328(+)
MNGRRLLVEPDTDTLQLIFDLSLMDQGLHHVEDDQDETATHRDSDHLLASAFAVLGALDDPRQVEQLNLGSFVKENARHAGQRRELVGRDQALLTCHLVQERGLPNGRETHQADSRVPSLLHLETLPSAASSALPTTALGENLCAELCQLRLEQSKVGVCCLVFLRLGHLRLDVSNLLEHAHHAQCCCNKPESTTKKSSPTA